MNEQIPTSPYGQDVASLRAPDVDLALEGFAERDVDEQISILAELDEQLRACVSLTKA